MDAQTVFYILASIFIALGIIFMVTGIVFVMYLFTLVRRTKQGVLRLIERKSFLGFIPHIIAGIHWFRQRNNKS